MKKFSALFFLLQCTICLSAQTLFTYGKNAVTKEEFLKAYNKNNTATVNTTQAYKEYLDLYIKFKLKVQAALDAKLDTLPAQKAELLSFRNQIADNYMNDETTLNALVEEAFKRSQKDIRVSHIYIPFAGTDTTMAYRSITEAYAKLKLGNDFASIAKTYSKDPGVITNGGDLGFITVFTLPYEFESLAYTTVKGTVSAIYKSNSAYHIIKPTEERPAAGRMKAAQILLAFPPGASDAAKAKIKAQADSLYQSLVNGASFSELAAKYSNDNISYMAGGSMPEFGVGKYEPAFENAAFALDKAGAITKPVLTSFGYHIIQRMDRVPVSTVKDEQSLLALKQAIQADKRIELVKKALTQKIMKEAGYKKATFNQKAFTVFVDSILSNRSTKSIAGITDKTALFSFPKQVVTAGDFNRYLDGIKNSPELWQGRSNTQLLQQYTETVAMEYYRNNLERYNSDFAYQLNEFKEGNLLFEVMQREIWDKAAGDSIGLKKYFDANRNKYWWEKSADAIFFTASDSATAVRTRQQFLTDRKSWKLLAQNSDGMLQTDSARFELTQIPVANADDIKAGFISPLVKSATDNITNFVYIIKRYDNREPRNFDDARGFVMNDYQQWLEEKWLEALRKKYPVKINNTVIEGLGK